MEKTIKSKVLSIVLMLTIFVSMTPMLTGEAFAVESTVEILKANGEAATSGSDYSYEAGVYSIISDNLVITTEGPEAATASFVIPGTVKHITLKDCNIKGLDNKDVFNAANVGSGAQAADQNDLKVSIIGNCTLKNGANDGSQSTMYFHCYNNHSVTISGARGSNLYVESLEGKGLCVSHEHSSKANELLTLTDYASIQLRRTTSAKNDKAPLSIAGAFLMDCAAKIDAQQFGGYSALAIAGDVTIKDTAYMHCESPETAIDMNNDGDHNLSVLDDASLTAKGGVYTTVCLWGEALFDTTGTVEIDNAYDSALRCKTFKAKNKEGKIILRANGEKIDDGSSALQLTDKDNYYLGKTVNMYGSSDKDADEKAVTTKLGDYWAVETPSDYVFYHPYVGPNTPARTILIKGVSTQDEINKVKDDAAQELAEQTAKLQAEIAFLQRQIIENEEATLEVKDELVNLTKSLMSLDKNPKADLAANGLVKLSWDPIPGATGYAIYVVNDNGIDELLGEVITNSFEAAPSAQYRIKAFTVLDNERVYGEAQVVKTNIKKASISSLKSTSYRKVVVKYKKITGVKTYEIKYKVSGKNWKTIKTTKLTRTIKNLTPGKRCYVKVRGVCNNGSKKIPGPWSATKSVIVSW